MQFFQPKPQFIPVLIVLLDDSQKVFNVSTKQSGLNLLATVAKTVEVSHYEYFGLKYFDMFKKPQWIRQKKSVQNQLKKKHAERSYSSEKDTQMFRMFFQVRYYPRDPTCVPSEHFRYQIFLQIRKDISQHKLVIKNESDLAQLFALVIQSDFGDFQESRFASNYVRQAVANQIMLNQKLEELIRQMHAALKGTQPVHAEYQFLEKIRWFESYGSIVYPVKDIYNRNCLLSINPQGFSLKFQKDPGYNYEIFWPRISSIRRKNRKLFVKEKAQTTQNHLFEMGDKTICIELYKVAQDHFAFFKLKKNEKPLTKDPVKRTIGQRTSREFGYTSDLSEVNQYSDTTLTSFPDSINTTQSTKSPKIIKKAKLNNQRNCISDIEESALSRKHRRVIVSKSQTETEDEVGPYQVPNYIHHHYTSNNRHHHHSVYHNESSPEKSMTTSFERLPPDYIYENKRNVNSSPDIQQRTKRLKKKNPSNANQNSVPRSRPNTTNQKSDGDISDRKYLGNKEMEPYFMTKQPGYEIIRTKSGDSIETKARIRRKLPKTDMPQHSFDNIPDNFERTDQSTKPNPSKGQTSRSSPTKRLLPDLNTIFNDKTDLQPDNHHKHSRHTHSSHNKIRNHSNSHYKNHNHQQPQYKMPLELRSSTIDNELNISNPPAVPKHRNSLTPAPNPNQSSPNRPHIRHPIPTSVSTPVPLPMPVSHNYYAPHNFLSNPNIPNLSKTNHTSAFQKHQPINELKKRPEPRNHSNYSQSMSRSETGL